MSYKTLEVSIENKIAHVVLNRPNELNTMTAEFWRELPQVITEIDEQASARVIVLSSTGKHFTAGMDLSVFTNPNNIPISGDPARSAESACVEKQRKQRLRGERITPCRAPETVTVYVPTIQLGPDRAHE